MSHVNYGTTPGEFVRRWRTENQYTQKEAGEILGVDPQYVSNVERGVHPRPITFCAALLDHLDEKRRAYMIDLMKEMATERLADKGGRNGDQGQGRRLASRGANGSKKKPGGRIR